MQKTVINYSSLTLAASVAAVAFAWSDPARSEPVEYVRICDAYGSGYFYIPGTETCLKIGGGYQHSWARNTNDLGVGTVVIGGIGGKEGFGGHAVRWINRDGFDIGFRTEGDYGKIGTKPIVGFYGSWEAAWGRAGYSGNQEIGTGGVTHVGFTFLDPHGMYGTGVIGSTPGLGLDSWGTLNNSWNRINLGMKIGCDGEDDDLADGAPNLGGLRIRGRFGVFYEDYKIDSSGRSDLTYFGSPYDGYYQTYDYTSKDQYLGARVGGHVGFQPQLGGKLRTGVSGDVYLGYHTGSGSYMQVTGVGGGMTVSQSRSYSTNGFAVGAGLSANVSYEVAPGWQIGTKVEWSVLPKVTSFKAPSNPGEQAAAGFKSSAVQRVFAGVKLTRSF